MSKNKLLAFSSLLLLSFSALAQDYQVDTITTSGNKIITRETVLHYLDLKEKALYNDKVLDNKVIQAYESGLFKEITLKFEEKNKLLVEIKEQPIIGDIKFYGNKKVNDKDIISSLKTQVSGNFSAKRLKSDTEAILKLYQDKGYFGAVVNPKLIEKDGSLTIAFEIKEGEKTTIKKILFFGQGPFADKELKEAIMSREWALYRILSGGYYFDPDRLELDKELLEAYYHNHGYPFAKVTSSKVELSNDSKFFTVKFYLSIGEKMILSKVLLEDHIKLDQKQEIEKPLQDIKLGTSFNLDSLLKAEKDLSDLLAKKGYAFAKIERKLEKKGPKELIATLVINPSNKFFVNKINIKNNSSTREEVIRREMKISEKDGYDISKIERSIQRIRNLGFFESVIFQPSQVGNSDLVDLDIIVKEKKTMSAFFKAGYSTTMGALIGLNFAQSNLLGTGRNFSTNLTLAKLSQAVDISLTEPYFMDLDLAVGMGIFYENRLMRQWMQDSNNQLVKNKYATSSRGFNLNTNYYLTDFLQHGWDYNFSFEELNYQKANFISDFLKPDSKNHTVSSLGHHFFYDQTDTMVSTTKGYYIKVGQTVAGLGGNAKFIRHSAGAAYYQPLYKDKIIFKMSGKVGTTSSFKNDTLHPLDNFNSEDHMIRGFAYNGIGPRDSITNDSLGGKNYFSGSLEMKFPLGLPRELGFYGLAFLDAANLTGFDTPKNLVTTAKLLDSSKIRSSYGLSLVWESPLGLMRFDYGIPLAKTSFDQVQKFNFTLGKSF
jgi:outer membrane protein insertion porin family